MIRLTSSARTASPDDDRRRRLDRAEIGAGGDGSDAAEEPLEKDLATPSLWLLAAANALWRRTVRGELTAAEAAERLTELAKAPVASVPLEQVLPRPASNEAAPRMQSLKFP